MSVPEMEFQFLKWNFSLKWRGLGWRGGEGVLTLAVVVIAKIKPSCSGVLMWVPRYNLLSRWVSGWGWGVGGGGGGVPDQFPNGAGATVKSQLSDSYSLMSPRGGGGSNLIMKIHFLPL